MRRLRLGLFLLIVGLVIVTFVGWALLSGVFRIRNHANMKAVGIEVYWDSDLTKPVTEIDWDFPEPNENKTTKIYVKSTANVPSTLTLTTENWQPLETPTYITLFWSYKGEVLNPNDVVSIVLTLSVSKDVKGITNFSFDIVITTVG